MASRSPSVPPTGGATPQPIRVHRVDKEASSEVRSLSPRYGGLFYHWHSKRSRYCSGDDCPASLHRLERFWKGYAAAQLYQQREGLWVPVVLEITEHAELELRGRWQRGQVWKFQRVELEKVKEGRVVAELLGTYPPELLPPEFDVRPVLVHLYHALQIELNKANPLPPRVVGQAEDVSATLGHFVAAPSPGESAITKPSRNGSTVKYS